MLDNISVGDFAEQLMREEKEKGQSLSPPTFDPVQSNYSPNVLDQVDISNVEVPSNFVDTILEANELSEEEEEHPVSVIKEDRSELREGNPLADKAVGIIVEGLGRILDDVKVTLMK